MTPMDPPSCTVPSPTPSKHLNTAVVSKIDCSLKIKEPSESAMARRRKGSKISESMPERSKRGRKSKADAMKALNGHNKPGDQQQNPKKPLAPAPSRHPSRIPPPPKVPEGKLDFSSIRTEAPREFPHSRQHDRLFGLEHCPVFYPTVDEFKEPMRYFESINTKVNPFGIGKIVPPTGWRPPFVLDTEQFKFKTRLQRLNSMEASARANFNFLDQLYLFHKQRGTGGFITSGSKLQVPVIDHRPVDLWRLRKEINDLGGYDNITVARKWSFLAKTMGYNVKASPAISFKLKAAYVKIIAPFDEYVNRVRQSPVKSANRDSQRARSPDDSLSPLTSSLADQDEANRPLNSKDVANEDDLMADDSMRSAAKSHGPRASNASMASGDQPPEDISRASSFQLRRTSLSQDWDDSPDRGGDICEICGSDEDDPNILLCDFCDKGFHLQCLTPPLLAVPEGNWYCDACIVSTGNEFGFEEGKEHTLSSFQRRADGFKRMWLETHPMPKRASRRQSMVKDEGTPCVEVGQDVDESSSAWYTPAFKDELSMEDFVEKEFWRLVESQSENVEIEYGADIHSAAYGSGFPNLEKHPLEPYSRDGWNLNNLPIAPGSLLRFIKSDIAGMTQPWIYVGMVFSTFAWHKEDHYTYSINYHHWGDTKTWYGVPGEDDAKLEEAMKAAAPELFEQQPDLMYQLVTLMSPGRLRSAGVRTYVCDQRPNEFVITCPRSYHSGFNHGFNLNEAVNFCLPDWLKEGSLCVKHYKELQKMPVFSHDELLVTIFHNEKSPRASRWLLPHFREMVEREIADRQTAIAEIPNVSPEITIDPSDLPEDQVQCHYCKSFAFLSQVTSPGCSKVSCLHHSHTLGDGEKVLRYKYSDDELQVMLQRVNSRSIKAGRVVDVGGIEQRTSTRKRKPSAALLEAARAALPLAQKIKLAHASSTFHREGLGDASVRSYADSVMANDSSLDYDEDERMEHGSQASDPGIKQASKGEDEDVNDNGDLEPDDSLLSSSIDSRAPAATLAMSAPAPIPALDVARPRPPRNPQTVKLSKLASHPEYSCPSLPAKTSAAQSNNATVHSTPSASNAAPVSPKTRLAEPPVGKRRGRPPKSAETRAAEAEARRQLNAQREATMSASARSTPVHRLPVVAQIDVGGSASIVQLTPSRDSYQSAHAELGGGGSHPQPTQPTSEPRKRKSKKAVTPIDNPVFEPLPLAPPSRPSTSERPGCNVIRIKSTPRAVSQPADASKVPQQIHDDSRPTSISGPTESSQLVSQHQPSVSEYDRHRQGQIDRSQENLPPTSRPMTCKPPGSTPSSLLNILNPVGTQPHSSFDHHSAPPKRHLPHESSSSAHHLYHNPSSAHLGRPSHSHSPSLPQCQFVPYHAQPQSPTMTSFGGGCSQPHQHSSHPCHAQHSAHPSHHQQSSSHAHCPSPHLQHPAPHFQAIHSPYPTHSQPSPQITHHSMPQRASPISYSATSPEQESPHHVPISSRPYLENPTSAHHGSSQAAAYWNPDQTNGSNSPASWWGDQESPVSHSG